MGKTNPRTLARVRRKKHIRKRIFGTSEKPRLAVFRSNRHIYAQIIDDDAGHTLVSASSLEKDIASMVAENSGKKGVAQAVGKLVATRAKEKGIKQVAFDRGGYIYHGRVKALAEGARETGLEF